MPTLAVVGQASVCFACGQPLPKDIAAAALAAPPLVERAPLAYPLTSAQNASPLEPPPNPYGSAQATSATLIGPAGQFAIRADVEVRVGRDPATCPITLSEPRVSGVHATMRFERGFLSVRDEGSNNGTYIGGVRLPASVWSQVPNGASLRFGPVEFTAKME
jgi:pSer/pThr/pTyr-binding forkhead associated (FHA) protein